MSVSQPSSVDLRSVNLDRPLVRVVLTAITTAEWRGTRDSQCVSADQQGRQSQQERGWRCHPAEQPSKPLAGRQTGAVTVNHVHGRTDETADASAATTAPTTTSFQLVDDDVDHVPPVSDDDNLSSQPHWTTGQRRPDGSSSERRRFPAADSTALRQPLQLRYNSIAIWSLTDALTLPSFYYQCLCTPEGTVASRPASKWAITQHSASSLYRVLCLP